MLKKVECGYRLTGKWSYGSGFSHATYTHSAAFVDDGTGKPANDENSNAIIMATHAPVSEHKQLGNRDVLVLAAIGHTGWALGTGRRMLDEIATFARSKSGRAGMLGESKKLWFDYGRAEALYRAARAFVFETWLDIEATVEAGNNASAHQISLVHLTKSEIQAVCGAIVSGSSTT